MSSETASGRVSVGSTNEICWRYFRYFCHKKKTKKGKKDNFSKKYWYFWDAVLLAF